MSIISLPYGADFLEIEIPEKNLLAVASPNPVRDFPDPVLEIQRALENPIAAFRLRDVARGAQKVVIAADDMTRSTPVKLLVKALLDELNQAGVRDEQVTVLIALGTHRLMTAAEILDHFGDEVVRRVQVVNHEWQAPANLVSLGTTPNGTPVSVNRLALEADLLLGVGSVVPHHIPGFSGGAKIIQPGITGPETTGATHFLSTRAEHSYLGQEENPVRAEIERIAVQVGLRAILNVVLDHSGRLVRAFYGDPVVAHRAAVFESRQVYGVPLPSRADIVIAVSHPCDIEFWQAHKALYPAEISVKEGGTIILVTPAPEGVSVMHRDLLGYAIYDPDRIERMILDGSIRDQVSGALALAWSKVRQHARVSLVSGGIDVIDSCALGFSQFLSVDMALQQAFRVHGDRATVTVLTHAPDTLPILNDHKQSGSTGRVLI